MHICILLCCWVTACHCLSLQGFVSLLAAHSSRQAHTLPPPCLQVRRTCCAHSCHNHPSCIKAAFRLVLDLDCFPLPCLQVCRFDSSEAGSHPTDALPPRDGSQAPCSCLQVKRTCYAQSSQIRQIRRKMVEIMTREASSCDLKELVGKFIPEAIGERF